MKISHKYFVMLASALMFISTSASAAKFDLGDNGKLDLWGFAQMQIDQFSWDDRENGEHPRADQDGVQFNIERLRFGSKYKINNWEFGLHFDAQAAHRSSEEGDLPGFIRDVYGQYKFDNGLKVKIGQFKMPLGMAYTLSGTRLPLVERTLTSRLVLERTLGAMVSMRNIGGSKETGGFGFDLAMGNPASRSQGVTENDENDRGDDHTYVARLVYDMGKKLHIQAAFGSSEDAGSNELCTRTNAGACMTDSAGDIVLGGGFDSEDYEVFDVGVIYKDGPIRIRAEYIDGTDIRGIEDNDEEAWFVEAGYRFSEMMEGVVRYQEAECDGCGARIAGTNQANDDLTEELQRFEVGVSFFLGQNDRNGRVQLYYASVGDDEEDYSGRAQGGGGGAFATDQIAAQLQMRF